MQLDILTPGKTLYSGEASVVTFPGADGKFQVMNDHAPLIATLAEGQVVIKDAKGKTEEHTSELQSHSDLVCRLLLEKKKKNTQKNKKQKQKTKTQKRQPTQQT